MQNEEYWELKARDFIPLYGIYTYSDRVTKEWINLRRERNRRIESIINSNTFPRATLIALANGIYIVSSLRLFEILSN
ncbi:MAG TPA: hypothetical protein VJZ93_01855 [Candidatus Nanoarchaeia archaeon]|nr:hypothetical protein [Candidatus Nanoarchaeia archaeon]